MFRSQVFLFHEKPQSLLVAEFVTGQHHVTVMERVICLTVVFIIIIIIINIIFRFAVVC
jgi:hypothetical protein